MLDLARPEIRTTARSQNERLTWGIVDVILGLIMLPFGVWLWLIERMVHLVSAIGALDLDLRR
jgi:hypothetical protein